MATEVPSFYYRENYHPAPTISPLNETLLSYALRITKTALPVICLYNPAGFVVSIAIDTTRVVTCLGVSYSAFQKKGYTEATRSLLFASASIMSLAATVFCHPLGLILTTGFEIGKDIYDIVYYLQKKNYRKALEKSCHLLNNSIYLATLCTNTYYELLILSLVLQLTLHAYSCYKKYRKGNKNIELTGKLILTFAKGYKTTWYMKEYYKMHRVFINMQRDRIAATLYHISSYFSRPFWWDTTQAIRIATTLNPKSAMQCNNKIQEVATRCFFGGLILATLPIALTGKLIEIGVYGLGKTIAYSPFTYLKGAASEKIYTKSDEVSILHMNCCLPDGGFCMPFGGVASGEERVENIANLIKEKQPDVICLQEVNSLKDAYILFNSLKGKYAHFFIDIGSCYCTQNSGLFVASKKYPTQNLSFTSFNTGKGLQKMVNKGFFKFSIFSSNTLLAHIVTTHLSPSKNDFYPTEREKQIRKEEMQMILDKIKKDQQIPTIIAGDMNINAHSPEYKDADFFSSGFSDKYNTDTEVSLENATCLTEYLTQLPFKTPTEQASIHKEDYLTRLDYALIRDPDKFNFQTERIKFPDEENPLSDHYPLISTFIPQIS